MHTKNENRIKLEFRENNLIELIHQLIELNYIQQSATSTFIINHHRSQSDVIYLRFLSEKIEILHKVINEARVL